MQSLSLLMDQIQISHPSIHFAPNSPPVPKPYHFISLNCLCLLPHSQINRLLLSAVDFTYAHLIAFIHAILFEILFSC